MKYIKCFENYEAAIEFNRGEIEDNSTDITEDRLMNGDIICQDNDGRWTKTALDSQYQVTKYIVKEITDDHISLLEISGE